MTLDEKLAELKTILRIAEEDHDQAAGHRIAATQALRVVELAEDKTQSALNFARKRVRLFKAFYDPGR